jgi:hypothetical protein
MCKRDRVTSCKEDVCAVEASCHSAIHEMPPPPPHGLYPRLAGTPECAARLINNHLLVTTLPFTPNIHGNAAHPMISRSQQARAEAASDWVPSLDDLGWSSEEDSGGLSKPSVTLSPTTPQKGSHINAEAGESGEPYREDSAYARRKRDTAARFHAAPDAEQRRGRPACGSHLAHA